MFRKLLPLFVLCGSLCAAELPDGWMPYMSAAKDVTPGTVTMQDNLIRVVDPGAGVEAGITRVMSCKPGDYIRFSAEVKSAGDKKLVGMALSAFYITKPLTRAGFCHIPAAGRGVLVFGPVPEGVKEVKIFVYSARKFGNDFLISVPKVEISKKPFEK